MSFPISKKDLTPSARFFFDYATNPESTTIERVSFALLLSEAEAAKEGYVFKWEKVIQRGWTVTVFLEPEDLQRPVFLLEKEEVQLDPKLDRDDAKRVEEAALIVSLMSSQTWLAVVRQPA